jgi:hypothetical protein
MAKDGTYHVDPNVVEAIAEEMAALRAENETQARALALAGKVQDEMGLELARVRQELEKEKSAYAAYRAHWEPIHKTVGNAYTRQGGELATLRALARDLCDATENWSKVHIISVQMQRALAALRSFALAGRAQPQEEGDDGH